MVAPEERTAPERRARWQRGAGRALAIGLAGVYVLVSLIPLFYGVLAFEVRCGDDCGDGSGWMENGDAWQWDPLALLGVAVFIAAVVLAVAVVARAGRLGRRAAVASGACWVGLSALAVGG